MDETDGLTSPGEVEFITSRPCARAEVSNGDLRWSGNTLTSRTTTNRDGYIKVICSSRVGDVVEKSEFIGDPAVIDGIS